jgi:hypothetical protein
MLQHTSPVIRRIGAGLLIVALLAILPGIVGAQAGGTLTYGATVSGSLTADVPFIIYQVEGGAGDQITAYGIGLTAQMAPGLSLLGPSQQQIMASSGDPSGTGSGVARLNYYISTPGTYSLMVANTLGQPGDFILRLDAAPTAQTTALRPNAPLAVDLPAGAPPAVLTFTGSADTTSVLTLTGSAFAGQVYRSGIPITTVTGHELGVVSLSLPPGADPYVLAISSLQPDAPGGVEVLLSSEVPSAPTSQSPAIVTATPDAPAATSAPTVCRATSGVNVNIRSGPSTNYPTIGALFAGTFVEVIGRNTNASWWVLDYNGQQGWVANSVVTLEGPCANVSIIVPPPSPTPVPPTATPTPAATPTPQISFTVNGLSGVTINPGQCVTVAWSTANVSEVYYEGDGVVGNDSVEECPMVSTTYTLRVVLPDSTEAIRTVSVNVIGPTVTP